MVSIAPALLKKINESLRNTPLEKGEIREIAFGNSISLERYPYHDNQQHLFSLQIDGKTIYFYSEGKS